MQKPNFSDEDIEVLAAALECLLVIPKHGADPHVCNYAARQLLHECKLYLKQF